MDEKRWPTCPECGKTAVGGLWNGPAGERKCVACWSDDMYALQKRVEKTEALLAPTGSVRERHLRLVEAARRLGFEGAMEALWSDLSPECPLTSLKEEAEAVGVGELCPIRLGVFLDVIVYVTSRWDDGQGGDAGGDVEYGTFDSEEEARAWSFALEVEHKESEYSIKEPDMPREKNTTHWVTGPARQEAERDLEILHERRVLLDAEAQMCVDDMWRRRHIHWTEAEALRLDRLARRYALKTASKGGA